MIAIKRTTISSAWLEALEQLIQVGGEAVNVAVAIEDPTAEDPGVRQVLDGFIETVAKQQPKQSPYAVVTVANTIFPQALYIARLGRAARPHLYEMHRLASRVDRRRNRDGTYFDRLVNWSGPEGQVNQLDMAIDRLEAARKRGHRVGNAFELQLSGGLGEGLSLPVYQAGRDNRVMGFPCLSHISLSLFDSRVHMTALYRNHDWISRAYGNYVGLGRLLTFIAREAGFESGELVCVSSHATAEIGRGRGFGRQALEELTAKCRSALRSNAMVTDPGGLGMPV